MTRVALPTLFAWGDRDSFAPPASGNDLAARMWAARVDVLDDAGHLHCSTCHNPAENLSHRTIDFTKPLIGGYTWELGEPVVIQYALPSRRV